MTDNLTRRSFLLSTAAAAAFTIVPRHVLGGPRHIAPSEKVNIAGIGIGGQGASNLKNLETENIIALCDVDPLNYAAKTIAKYPKAKVYVDFREMLEKEKDVDAVLIATPDHTHAVISMAAMKAGKHVYCQKPLTHDVYEARMLAQAAKKYGVVTQMGIQGHSGEGIRLITEWIQAGLIGEVRQVDAWCDLTYYPWGHAYWSSKYGAGRPTDTPELPKGMNWDLWLGPAKQRPYHPAYHPMVWRCWWDFGNGMMGDRGAHTLDPVVTALKLTQPVSIDATTCGMTKEVHPLSSIVTYQFPTSLDGKPVKVIWYEGTRPPRPEGLEEGRKLPKEGGAIFNGTKGKIWCGVYGDGPRVIPEQRMQELAGNMPPKTIPRIQGGAHEQDWVNAIKNGKQAGADFSYSGPLTEICMLGNVAKRADTILKWDYDNMAITNNKNANEWLRTKYREGWSLE